MATFITLVSFTEQGIQNVKESPDRFEKFRSMAEGMGVSVKSAFWTVGSYDMVVTVEGEEAAATAVLLKVGSLGNTRTQTMRAFTKDEMNIILSKMP